MSEESQKVFEVLKTTEESLKGDYSDEMTAEGTLAANLHNFYNIQGYYKGWGKPEYTTELSKQDQTNKKKNVFAERDVIVCLFKRYSENKELNIAEEMKGIVDDYINKKENAILEEFSDSQHNFWKGFVEEFQSVRVIPGTTQLENPYAHLDAKKTESTKKFPGEDRIQKAMEKAKESKKYKTDVEVNPKLNLENFVQFHENYNDMTDDEKLQDRNNVVVIIDGLLAKAEIGYEKKIDVAWETTNKLMDEYKKKLEAKAQ